MEKSDMKKISGWERFWIVVASLFILAGLFFAILGIVGDHLPVAYSDNWILKAEVGFEAKLWGLNYRWFGVILLLVGTVVSVISLNFFEKKSDADQERAERRAQRMKVISNSADAQPVVSPENTTEGAQEVEAKPAEEKPAEAEAPKAE